MVGSKQNLPVSYKDQISGEIFLYEDDNTGYNGYAIRAFNKRKGIYELLKETNCLSLRPDIIILQIGTNNVIDK